MVDALVFGARGMLGKTISSVFGDRCQGVGKAQCDITDPNSVINWIQKVKPKVVINCAAYTNVDNAEHEKEAAFRINGIAPGIIAQAAREEGCRLFHFSTDYVFNGSGVEPWKEDYSPCPINYYGLSKLEGEQRVQEAGGLWCIIRTQWLFGPGRKNFVDTIRLLSAEKDEIRVVSDQFGAPTYALDLALALAKMSDLGAEGIFHLANSGYASWFQVADRIRKRINSRCRIIPCASDELSRPAKRPANSRLDCSKAEETLGIFLRPWTEAIDEYLGG